MAIKDDVRKLVRDINDILPEPIPADGLNMLFDGNWELLAEATDVAKSGAEGTRTTRDSVDILEEILDRVRRLEVGRTLSQPYASHIDADEARLRGKLSAEFPEIADLRIISRPSPVHQVVEVLLHPVAMDILSFIGRLGAAASALRISIKFSYDGSDYEVGAP